MWNNLILHSVYISFFRFLFFPPHIYVENYVRSVVTELKDSIMCVVTPCSLVQIHWCFGERTFLYLQKEQVPPKRPHISTRLDSVASQTAVFLVENAVRTSNLALQAFYSLNYTFACIWIHAST